MITPTPDNYARQLRQTITPDNYARQLRQTVRRDGRVVFLIEIQSKLERRKTRTKLF